MKRDKESDEEVIREDNNRIIGGGTKEWRGNERQHGMMVREDEVEVHHRR